MKILNAAFTKPLSSTEALSSGRLPVEEVGTIVLMSVPTRMDISYAINLVAPISRNDQSFVFEFQLYTPGNIYWSVKEPMIFEELVPGSSEKAGMPFGFMTLQNFSGVEFTRSGTLTMRVTCNSKFLVETSVPVRLQKPLN